MKTLSLGISEFALPSPRVGSLEVLSGLGPRMDEGVELHVLIQEERRLHHPEFIAEKWVTHSFARTPYRVTISGRMDGFYTRPKPLIEEIKSAFDINALKDILQTRPEHPYCLQLRTYGYLHYLHTGQIPQLQFMLISSRDRARLELTIDLDLPEYETWLGRRLDEIVAETKMFGELRAKRQNLAKKFKFPFTEPRPGQLELMETIRAKLKGQAKMLLQAPTGLGKTAGVLFPTLTEALARGQKVLYLTPKNSQHGVAEDAVERLQKSGLRIKSVTLNAKTKMCLKSEPHCDPRHCEFARDHFTKISQGDLVEKLAKKKKLSAETIRRFAREHEVCPFELQFQVLARADVVIGDYNYVFSPHHSSGRLSYNGLDDKSSPNLVIDEAHNLSDRARDYFSATVSVAELRKYQDAASHLPWDLKPKWDELLEEARHLIESRREPGTTRPHVARPNREAFHDLNGRIQEFRGRYLSQTPTLVAHDPILRWADEWSAFTQALEWEGDEFVTTYTPEPHGGRLKVSCHDASTWLKERYKEFSHVIGFSATLKPFEYHQKLLGLDEATETAEFSSPFPQHHRKLLIIPQVSTKYHDRPREAPKIKEAIERIVRLRPGNYFVFFPSFAFLNLIARQLDLPDFDLLLQEPDMRRSDIETYLERLRDGGKPALLLAVQGGVFAEGVDYPGDMAIGALIVGPGLPAFDFERELLREYFQTHHGDGFAFAYTYPAMARVIQSAGRVIRSAQDRGLIVLMDRRFMEKSYVQAMPADWVENDPQNLVSNEILRDIARFWESHESP